MTRLATTDSFNDGYSSEEEDEDEDDSEIINFRYTARVGVYSSKNVCKSSERDLDCSEKPD